MGFNNEQSSFDDEDDVYRVHTFVDIINDCLKQNVDGHDILIMIIDNNEAGFDDDGKDDKNNLDHDDVVNLAWISLKF